jgi:N-acetylglucosaminyldiphosphoundecaprenol N-acetyl-beta-D-mannosaminyltransferase
MIAPERHGLIARTSVFGVDIDEITLRQAVEQAVAWIDDPTRKTHISSGVNLQQLMLMQNNPLVDSVIRNSAQITADGHPIVWASRGALPERVPSIDVMHELLEMTKDRPLRVFMLGATQESLELSCKELRCRYPLLNIVGARNGYYSDEEIPILLHDISASRPQVLFVAISSPKREILFERLLNEADVTFVLGVGGAFDILAGKTRRAPLFIQKLWLEWFWRMLQEPKRMVWRCFGNGVFLFRLLLQRTYRKSLTD